MSSEVVTEVLEQLRVERDRKLDELRERRELRLLLRSFSAWRAFAAAQKKRTRLWETFPVQPTSASLQQQVEKMTGGRATGTPVHR
jgi:hypothetical protein